MFAAANANLIHIYSTFSLENTANLKGHNGKVSHVHANRGLGIMFVHQCCSSSLGFVHSCVVILLSVQYIVCVKYTQSTCVLNYSNCTQVRDLVWSTDDSRLFSCGMGGAVYEWNILTAKREKECVLKSCSYTSIAVSPDLKTTYAVGSDHTLKQILLAEAQVYSYMLECALHIWGFGVYIYMLYSFMKGVI